MYRTPFAVSILREHRSITGEAGRDPQRFRGLAGYIGAEPAKFITSENGLNMVRVLAEMIIAKASVTGIDQIWYDTVIPCLAYKMMSDEESEFSEETLRDILGRTAEKTGVYYWAYDQITGRFPEFRFMTSEYIMRTLAGTGLVGRTQAGGYRFIDRSLQSYLAARFAAQVIADGSIKALTREVMEFALRVTDAAYPKSTGFAEFGRHLIEELIPSCSSRDSFDPQVFRLAANVSGLGCAGVRLRAADMCGILTRHMKRRYMFSSVRRNKLPALNDPENIESLITLDHCALLNCKNRMKDTDRWELLHDISHDLNYIAASYMLDIFMGTDNKKLYDRIYTMNGEEWDDDFSILILEQFVRLADDDHEGCPPEGKTDMISKVYQEIETVDLEKAEYLEGRTDVQKSGDSVKYRENYARIRELRESIHKSA